MPLLVNVSWMNLKLCLPLYHSSLSLLDLFLLFPGFRFSKRSKKEKKCTKEELHQQIKLSICLQTYQYKGSMFDRAAVVRHTAYLKLWPSETGRDADVRRTHWRLWTEEQSD